MIKPFYIFGIEAKVQQIVGLESYGLYFFYFNFIFLFQFINDPGLQNWNAQHLPKNRSNAGQLIPEILQTKLLLGFAFIVVINSVSNILGYADAIMVFYITLNFLFSSLFMLLRSMIAGMGYYLIDSFISVMDKLLLIIMLGYILYFTTTADQTFKILTFVKLQSLTYLLVSLIAASIVLSKIDIVFKTIDWSTVKSILQSGFPYLLIMIFMTAYSKLDGVMLGWLLDDNKYQAGIYAAAYRFYDAANMGGYLFASLLLPMFSANMFQKGVLQELIIIGTKLSVAISLMLIAIIFFYGENLLYALYSYAHPNLLTSLRILILTYCLVSLTYIFGTYISATGKVKKLNILFATGLCVNIILCVVLIPKFGASGAALSAFITQLLVLTVQVYFVKKELDISLYHAEWKHAIFFGISIFSIFWMVTMFPMHDLSWYMSMTLSIVFCLPLLFIFKILDKKEVLMMYKAKN